METRAGWAFADLVYVVSVLISYHWWVHMILGLLTEFKIGLGGVGVVVVVVFMDQGWQRRAASKCVYDFMSVTTWQRPK